MVQTIGEFVGANRNLDGDLCITFSINEDLDKLQKLNDLKGKELAIEIKQYRKAKSLEANGYFWKLCSLMAEKLQTDKETVYLMELRKYGQSEYLQTLKASLPYFKSTFRHIDIECEYTIDGIEFADIIGWYGIHLYNSLEMSQLIDGTVEDAKLLGIDTMTPEEIKRMEASWKPKGEDHEGQI